MIFDTMAVKTRVAVLAVMQIAQCHLTQRAARKLYTAVLEPPGLSGNCTFGFTPCCNTLQHI